MKKWAEYATPGPHHKHLDAVCFAPDAPPGRRVGVCALRRLPPAGSAQAGELRDVGLAQHVAGVAGYLSTGQLEPAPRGLLLVGNLA